MRKLSRKVRMVGGCDILLTHAPAAGVGDLDDLPHRGFECFNTALESWNPDYMVHGHVHQCYGHDFQRERQHACGATIINACGYTQFELDEDALPYPWLAGSLAQFANHAPRAQTPRGHRVLYRQNTLVTATKGTRSPLWWFWPAIARNPVLHEAEPGFFSNACFTQAVTSSYSAKKSRWTAGSTLTPGPMVEDTEMDLTYLPLAEEGLTRRISVYRAA